MLINSFIYHPDIAKEIQTILIFNMKGTLIWSNSKDGKYHLCDAYNLISSKRHQPAHHNNFSHLDVLCKLKIPNKIKSFAWKLYHIALPLGDNLLKRHFNITEDRSVPLDVE